MSRRTSLLAVLLLAVGAAVGPACRSDTPPPGESGGDGPGTGVVAASTSPVGGRAPEGFEEVTVRVRHADGRVTEHCLWLAADDARRQRGLMQVTDPGLGGKAGMLFQFERDQDGGFWMKDTPLPLSIAYLDADGQVVSTTDMAPCLDGGRCPTYAAAGPYRSAVEVPQGRLGSLGLDQDGVRLEVGGRSCVAAG